LCFIALLELTGWPQIWKTWKSQGIYSGSGKPGKVRGFIVGLENLEKSGKLTSGQGICLNDLIAIVKNVAKAVLLSAFSVIEYDSFKSQ